MMEGKVVLVSLPQADGKSKPRPALVLREMPPFQDLLLCGISSQLQQAVAGFDELLQPSEVDFATSGLRVASCIRLGFLAVLPKASVLGTLGRISPERHHQLRNRLAAYLQVS